jgi:uncharacterized protein YcaQ
MARAKAADTNGLSSESEKMLRRRLVEVSALASRPAYFGAHERNEIRAVEKQIVERLSPIDPILLDRRASELLIHFNSEDTVNWVAAAIAESIG